MIVCVAWAALRRLRALLFPVAAFAMLGLGAVGALVAVPGDALAATAPPVAVDEGAGPASDTEVGVDAEPPAPAPEPVAPEIAIAEAFAAFPALADVRVRQVGGLVVLDGEVATEADGELAAKIAASTAGVADVVDRTQTSYELSQRLAGWRSEGLTRLKRLLSAAPLLVIAAVVVWVAWWLGRRIARSKPFTRRMGARNPFLAAIAGQAVVLVTTLIGLLVALQLLDALALAGAIAGSAGILGITLGFAFRDLAENYIASLLLSLRRPFFPDDSVVVAGQEGIVVGLDSRSTLLMTPDGNHLRLPNATVFKSVILNHTRNPHRRFWFTMRLAPDTDADLALKAGLAALCAVPGVIGTPAPTAQLLDADQDWLQLQYFGWVDQRASNHGWVRSEAIRRVRQALACAGLSFARPTLSVANIEPPPPPRKPKPTAAPVAAPDSEGKAVREQVARARAEMSAEDLIAEPAPPAADPATANTKLLPSPENGSH